MHIKVINTMMHHWASVVLGLSDLLTSCRDLINLAFLKLVSDFIYISAIFQVGRNLVLVRVTYHEKSPQVLDINKVIA